MVGGGGGWWLEQVGLKLTQSPAKAGVEVRTELGNMYLGGRYRIGSYLLITSSRGGVRGGRPKYDF